MPRFVRDHAVATYFALTFALSWGGVLIVTGSSLVPDTKAELENALPLAIAAMLLGPSVAGLLMTGIVSGRAGLRDMFARMRIWRVDLRWYAVALLTAPLVMMTTLFALSLTSPVFVPGVFADDDPGSRLLFALVAGIAVGIAEEIGWTGFATPRLRRRHGILGTGLIIGVVWGAWHIIGNVVFASGAYSGALAQPLFMTLRIVGLLIGGLPAYRVLTVWVYDRTGSLFVAMLMHMSLTTSTLSLEPLGISGVSLVISDVVSVAAWWSVVAVVAWASGWRFWREPLHARVA
jgi:membrane protease YdiL (CAAX protease family)